MVTPSPLVIHQRTMTCTGARLARFYEWKVIGPCPVTSDVGRSTANRNEPQLHPALNALSPFDSVSRDRLSSIGF